MSKDSKNYTIMYHQDIAVIIGTVSQHLIPNIQSLHWLITVLSKD